MVSAIDSSVMLPCYPVSPLKASGAGLQTRAHVCMVLSRLWCHANGRETNRCMRSFCSARRSAGEGRPTCRASMSPWCAARIASWPSQAIPTQSEGGERAPARRTGGASSRHPMRTSFSWATFSAENRQPRPPRRAPRGPVPRRRTRVRRAAARATKEGRGRAWTGERASGEKRGAGRSRPPGERHGPADRRASPDKRGAGEKRSTADKRTTRGRTLGPDRGQRYELLSSIQGPLPRRRLRLAEFLYYTGRVSWQSLIGAIVWQRSTRPHFGELAGDCRAFPVRTSPGSWAHGCSTSRRVRQRSACACSPPPRWSASCACSGRGAG